MVEHLLIEIFIQMEYIKNLEVLFLLINYYLINIIVKFEKTNKEIDMLKTNLKQNQKKVIVIKKW